MQAYQDIPQIPYSDPAKCEPRLTEYKILTGENAETGLKLPNDCTGGAYARLGRLEGIRGERLFLHVYKGSILPLQLRVYGVSGSGKAVALTPCVEIRSIAYRLCILTRSITYDYLLVRFRPELPACTEKEPDPAGGTVSLAAYEGTEPTSPGSIVRQKRPECRDAYSPRPTEVGKLDFLPFSCDGRAVQRILLSTCSPEEDLQAWVEATGLEVSEAYYGEKGSVVALGTPPGMDLNTIGGSATEIRSHLQTGEGVVDPDYLINLFSPEEPAQSGGRLEQASGDDRQQKGGGEDYLRELLGQRDRAPKFDRNLAPLTVTVIDSGVDHSSVNFDAWQETRYRQRKETEYVRPWQLGYDFINHDFAPDDVAPHGTYVAATVAAQYRAERPLELVHMKTFGHTGISSFFGALVSIYEATAIGSRVINMSWGIYQKEAPAALTCALTTAAREGVFVVTSAGNNQRDLGDRPQWPAAYAAQKEFREAILTVASYWYGSYTYDTSDSLIDLRRDFSNFGDSETSVAAFMTAGVPEYQSGNQIFPLGTSISAPIVTGLLAHFLAEHPKGTLAEFRKQYFLRAKSLADRVQEGNYLPLEHTVVVS